VRRYRGLLSVSQPRPLSSPFLPTNPETKGETNMSKKDKKRREQEVSEPQTTTYLEAFVDGKWQRIEAFATDDATAIRALIKHRDANPTARTRITNSEFRVLLDLPATGQP
jgi:hypothetical protein